MLIFGITAVYISGIEILLHIGWYVLIYFLISYLLYIIWKKIHGKERVNLFHFFILFIYKVFISLAVLMGILIVFCYYQNELQPAKLPYYTLSNGEKTIRFQTMSHIASPEFYSDVRNNILRSKRAGYVLFFEGVRPGNAENTENFHKALGINLTENLYSKLSILYGIVAQNNNLFLGVENNKDYNIDLDINEIMEIYAQKSSLKQEKPSQILGHDMQNTEELISQSIDNLSQRELEVVRYLNQALMNMIIKNENIRNTILQTLGKEDIFSVILDERNKYLVENIIESEEEKIFIIYGLMHFDGVLKLLQASDSQWDIISTAEYQVIR